MISLGLLPPRFLLPAWSYVQLQHLASNRNFSDSRRRKAPQNGDKNGSPLIRTVYSRDSDINDPNRLHESRHRLPKSAQVDEIHKILLEEEVRGHVRGPSNGKETGSASSLMRISRYYLPEHEDSKKEAPIRSNEVVDSRAIKLPMRSGGLQSNEHRDGGEQERVYKEQKLQTKETPLETRSSGSSYGVRGANHPPDEIKEEKLSLFEQLFPDEAKKKSLKDRSGHLSSTDPPRLPPLDFKILQEHSVGLQAQNQTDSRLAARQAIIDDFRQKNTTILVLSRASTSLSEADFQRVIPEGEHLKWRGPGDFLKVIPAREYTSLSPKTHYYLFFHNVAHARAYQEHVSRLHHLENQRSAKGYHFHDVKVPLEQYTLSPPSVRLTLHMLKPPYRQNLCEVIECMGYPQLVEPEDKSGRAVLLWIEGYQPNTPSLRTMLSKDGAHRGQQWGPLRGLGNIQVLEINDGEDGDTEDAEGTKRNSAENDALQRGDSGVKYRKQQGQRWIISFEDEAEARRFVRVWHRQPYTLPLQNERPAQGEPAPLVHAEFLW